MTQHLVSTKIKLARCNRCQAYVLAAMCSGFRAAADPTPLVGMEALRGALLEGKTLYRLWTAAGRPEKLLPVSVADLGLEGAQTAVHVASHGCGCSAMDSTVFQDEPEEPQQDPQKAPVPPGRQWDGFPPPTAPEEAPQGHTRPQAAPHATHHLSDLPATRCQNCKQLIPQGDPNRIQIKFPRWEEEERTIGFGKRKRTRTYKGWQHTIWAVHSERCGNE